jgi:lysyl-tRNA synthetase class 2
MYVDQAKLSTYEKLKNAVPYLFTDRFERTHSLNEVQDLNNDTQVKIAGRIINIENHNESIYFVLYDIFGKVKIGVNKEAFPIDLLFLIHHLEVGDFIGITGVFNKNENIIQMYDVRLLTKALLPMPNQKEWLEKDAIFRGHQRYLDLILNPVSPSLFKIRIQFIERIREFLLRNGFLEVETPILVNVAELAGVEHFIIKDRSGTDLYMRLCHEDRVKRLLIGGFDRLFELGKSFRKEQVSWKHSPEFLQLECLQAYVNYIDMMRLAERLIIETIRESFIKYRDYTIPLNHDWKRITVRDAIKFYAEIDIGESNDTEELAKCILEKGIKLPEGYFEYYNLVDMLIDTFVKPNLIEPTFLVDYPAHSNYLARRKGQNSNLIERFELYIAGIEISNGYSLVNDPIDFNARLDHSIYEYQQAGEIAPSKDEDLILAKSYGMPPSAVVGFGVERILMLMTNQKTIHDMIWFPTHAQ